MPRQKVELRVAQQLSSLFERPLDSSSRKDAFFTFFKKYVELFHFETCLRNFFSCLFRNCKAFVLIHHSFRVKKKASPTLSGPYAGKKARICTIFSSCQMSSCCELINNFMPLSKLGDAPGTVVIKQVNPLQHTALSLVLPTLSTRFQAFIWD